MKDKPAIESVLLNIRHHPDDADLRALLADAVNELLQHDFPRLVQILYRVDVSETRLKELLRLYPQTDAGWIIADLLIDREKQKKTSREQFRKNDKSHADEEW